MSEDFREMEWAATPPAASVRTHTMLVLRDRMVAATRDAVKVPNVRELLGQLEAKDRPGSTEISDLGFDLAVDVADNGYLRGVVDGIRLVTLLPAGEVEFAARVLMALGGYKPDNAMRAELGMAPVSDDEAAGGFVQKKDGIALPPKPGNPVHVKAVA